MGQVADYDRVVMEIWTDGTIRPEGWAKLHNHGAVFRPLGGMKTFLLWKKRKRKSRSQ